MIVAIMLAVRLSYFPKTVVSVWASDHMRTAPHAHMAYVQSTGFMESHDDDKDVQRISNLTRRCALLEIWVCLIVLHYHF